MFIIYDLIFLIIAVIYLPVYLFKKKLHAGLLLRLGIIPRILSLDRPIWIHAVSVGEVMAIKALIAELKREYPKKRFVISTVTATGNRIAKSLAKDNDFVTYLPFDFGFIVKRVIDKINPSLFIIAETEIWPNLIRYLSKKEVPVIIVNARISDSSFKGYMMIKFLLRPLLNKISFFCVQAETDMQRLLRLGVEQKRIALTGNMKFDAVEQQKEVSDCRTKYRLMLCLKDEEKLLVAGSTHPGEEELILGAYKKLSVDFPGFKLLIAPRHPERSSGISRIVSSFGFRAVPVSSLAGECTTCLTFPVFILDTIGQLKFYYCASDIVFVGGSLVKKGGHNILEPASLAKPVIFGPYMFNFRDIADLFIKNNSAVRISDSEELKANIEFLLSNPEKREELQDNAKRLVRENQGATLKNIGFIKSLYNL